MPQRQVKQCKRKRSSIKKTRIRCKNSKTKETEETSEGPVSDEELIPETQEENVVLDSSEEDKDGDDNEIEEEDQRLPHAEEAPPQKLVFLYQIFAMFYTFQMPLRC